MLGFSLCFNLHSTLFELCLNLVSTLFPRPCLGAAEFGAFGLSASPCLPISVSFSPRPHPANRRFSRTARAKPMVPRVSCAFASRTGTPVFGHRKVGLDQCQWGQVVMNIKTMTFAARGFLPRRGASDEHIPQWICEKRATKSGRKGPAARRVAPNLACGVVARRLQTHWRGMLPSRASPQAKLGATNIVVFMFMTTCTGGTA